MKKIYYNAATIDQIRLYRELIRTCQFHACFLKEMDRIYIEKLIKDNQNLRISQKLNSLRVIMFFIRKNDISTLKHNISTLKMLIDNPERIKESQCKPVDNRNKHIVN